MENDMGNQKSAQGAFSNETAPPDYNDGKWHGWTGGECPVHPDSIVSVMFSDGTAIKGNRAGGWHWGHNISPNARVAALKVTTPQVEPGEPREFWVDPSANDVSATHAVGYIHVREVLG